MQGGNACMGRLIEWVFYFNKKLEMTKIIESRFFQTMNSWYHFPSFIYHELCHILMIIIFYPFIDCINYDRCKFDFERDGFAFYYGLEIHCQSRYAIVGILVSVAPYIGWAIGYGYLLATNNFLFLYFMLGQFGHFGLSDMDISCFAKNWNILFNKKMENNDD